MAPAATEPALPTVALTGDGDQLALVGVLDIRTLAAATESLQRQLKGKAPRALDLRKLEELDTPGALLLCSLAGKGV